MTTSKTRQMLSASDQITWRHIHIPHRVRAGIARLDMRNSRLGVSTVIDPALYTPEQRIFWRCSTDSIWEGRFAATRWLIELIGVAQSKDGSLLRPKRYLATDVLIDRFDGGFSNLFDLSTPEASFLAEIWKGCTQASFHVTHESAGHPDVREPRLMKALAIAIDHLQKTIYQAAQENICDYVLELPA